VRGTPRFGETNRDPGGRGSPGGSPPLRQWSSKRGSSQRSTRLRPATSLRGRTELRLRPGPGEAHGSLSALAQAIGRGHSGSVGGGACPDQRRRPDAHPRVSERNRKRSRAFGPNTVTLPRIVTVRGPNVQGETTSHCGDTLEWRPKAGEVERPNNRDACAARVRALNSETEKPQGRLS